MSEITLAFKGINKSIQCLNTQTMKEIFNSFALNANVDIDSLSFLYEGKEINKDLLLSEFKKQKNKEIIKILVLEKNNFITSVYKIEKNIKKLLIFGFAFVEKNKNNCKIIYNNEEYELIEKINIKEKENKNLLEIKLIGINNITDASFMFSQCDSLISLPDISKWNTIKITNMCNMFQECFSLYSLPDISNWNTSNVKDMKYMFYGCKSLLYLPNISKWNTSNVLNMSYMFDSCELLSVLPDISKWNTSKVTSMSNMFFHCKSLTFLPDISNWDMSNIKDLKYMFFNCLSLSNIPNVSKWKVDNAISIFLFGYCINLVKLPSKFKIKNE